MGDETIRIDLTYKGVTLCSLYPIEEMSSGQLQKDMMKLNSMLKDFRLVPNPDLPKVNVEMTPTAPITAEGIISEKDQSDHYKLSVKTCRIDVAYWGVTLFSLYPIEGTLHELEEKREDTLKMRAKSIEVGLNWVFEKYRFTPGPGILRKGILVTVTDPVVAEAVIEDKV